ncbi:acyltransferase [Mycobacterium sp. NPDC006124]|uniref:acyltransferase family protein n=1 Tax=Mycobacterium sp. NPDC006124 TaxID=3156729 RepID=UPI0033A0E65E
MADIRLAGPNFVRAAACLTVLAHHAIQRIDPEVLPHNMASWLLMGGFRVAAFFVLSGFLLARPFWRALERAERMPSLGVFAWRRVARILPAYWLALTVSFALSITMFGLPFYDLLGLRYISGLALVSDWHWYTFFPVEHNGPLWAISFEVTCYLLMPLCFAVLFALRVRGWLGLSLWGALIGLLVVAQLLIVAQMQPDDEERGWEFGYVGGAKEWMPYFNPVALFAIFAVGVLGGGVHTLLAERRSIIFDGLVVIGLVLAGYGMVSRFPSAEGYGVANIPYGFPLFPLGIALTLIGMPRSVWAGRLTERRPVVFVARISFGIYLWHFLVMDVVLRLWVHDYSIAGMTSLWRWGWTTAGVVVVTGVLATVSHYRLEAPVVRWARGQEQHIPVRPSSAG